MAINKYFAGFQNTNEQNLIDGLIIEAIQIHGKDLYYLPRTQENTNAILGEDTTSQFNTVYVIEGYLENVEGFEGDKNFLSSLGLNIKKQSNFLISDARFNQIVAAGPFNVPKTTITTRQRPLEGDLIYVPLTRGLFEINFADHEAVFYQLGKIYVWRLTVEMFKYSNEVINTGIPEIDAIATQYTNNNSIANDPIADNTHLHTDFIDNILDPNADEDPFSLGNF